MCTILRSITCDCRSFQKFCANYGRRQNCKRVAGLLSSAWGKSSTAKRGETLSSLSRLYRDGRIFETHFSFHWFFFVRERGCTMLKGNRKIPASAPSTSTTGKTNNISNLSSPQCGTHLTGWGPSFSFAVCLYHCSDCSDCIICLIYMLYLHRGRRIRIGSEITHRVGKLCVSTGGWKSIDREKNRYAFERITVSCSML